MSEEKKEQTKHPEVRVIFMGTDGIVHGFFL